MAAFSDETLHTIHAARRYMQPIFIDVVVYHKHCNDGTAAAWLAHKCLRGKVICIAADHADFKDPDAWISEHPEITDKNIGFFDVTPSRSSLFVIWRHVKRTMILDHHITSANEHVHTHGAFFDIGHSAAMLAWLYFQHGIADVDPPKLIRYIEDRDIWKWNMPHSKAFSQALMMTPRTDPKTAFDKFIDTENTSPQLVFLDSAIQELIATGIPLMEHQEAQVIFISKAHVMAKIMGYNTAVVNSSTYMSEIGNYLSSQAGVDMALIWWWNHKTQLCHVSFRSNSDAVDVSKVAAAHGGGGHARAAGIRCSWPIEELFDKQ